MKKKLVLLVMVLILAIPTIVTAGIYTAINGGAGGAGNAPSITFEFGGIISDKVLASINMAFIFNGDNIPSNTCEYPLYHNDYTDIGVKQDGGEFALIGKYGIEIIKNKRVFAFLLCGLSFYDEVYLVQSNVTSWYYEQSSETKTCGVYGGGFSCFPIKNIILQIEYDNRRGIVGGIGYCW